MGIPVPAATYLIDSYRFIWESDGVEIILDRLHEEARGGGLAGELTVVGRHEPVIGMMKAGRFNVSATRTRTEWVNDLEKHFPDYVPWYDIFEAFCLLTVQRWRDGTPTIDLSLAGPRAGSPYLLDPFVVASEASLLFADGGSGKSLFGLALALSVATGEPIVGIQPQTVGPVLFCDWEWDEHEHWQRLKALSAGYGIDIPVGRIFYRREYAKLAEVAPAIRRVIAKEGIVFVVTDSLGLARGGEPEDARTTLETFSASRSLGVPNLFIDHIPKDAKDRRYSFGSVYTRNSVRVSWRIDSIKSDDDLKIAMGFTQAKENLGWVPPRGGNMFLERDESKKLASARFEPTAYSALPSSLKHSLADKIEDALGEMGGAGSLSAIVEKLIDAGTPIKKEVLSVTLSKYKGRFQYQAGLWYTLKGHINKDINVNEQR